MDVKYLLHAQFRVSLVEFERVPHDAVCRSNAMPVLGAYTCLRMCLMSYDGIRLADGWRCDVFVTACALL